MKFYDPYYLIDPTKPRDWTPTQGRSAGGRFVHNSILTGAGDDNFPIDSSLWARYARGTRERLDALCGEDFRYAVIPDETILSWRMICEMYEAARDAIEAGASDEDAITAAHKYLADKQYETARAQLDRLVDDCKEMNAIDMSETISNWMSENWDVIPEVEL